MSADIKHFEEFIKPILTPGQQFLSFTCESLLSTGENYGSIMLKVDVKVMNENGEEDTKYYVAKTPPPTGFLWQIFNTKVSFKKEINMYTTVVPTLNNFGKEKGIDCLMDFFANSIVARISLDPNSDTVDQDAVLLLENLKEEGYDIGDRFNGFNEETAKYLLRDLAIFHAAPIAYKSVKPDEFQKKILPHLKKEFNFEPNEDTLNGFIKNVQKAVSRNSECTPYLNKIEDAIRRMKNNMENPTKGNDIFATMVHNDYWINNTMLKYEKGRPVSNKMVDFQIIEYTSLANDIVFFLYSSLNLELLKNKLDELIKFYYEEFIKTLAKLQHDVSSYSFESMMEEFAIVAKDFQFVHVLFMLTPIMTLKGKATELSELKEDSMLSNEDVLHENYYDKIQFILLDFVKRGWA